MKLKPNAMNEFDEIPQLPSKTEEGGTRHQKRVSGVELKPESPWATRIRKLLALHDERVHYVPFMPVPKRGGILKRLPKFFPPRSNWKNGPK